MARPIRDVRRAQRPRRVLQADAAQCDGVVIRARVPLCDRRPCDEPARVLARHRRPCCGEWRIALAGDAGRRHVALSRWRRHRLLQPRRTAERSPPILSSPHVLRLPALLRRNLCGDALALSARARGAVSLVGLAGHSRHARGHRTDLRPPGVDDRKATTRSDHGGRAAARDGLRVHRDAVCDKRHRPCAACAARHRRDADAARRASRRRVRAVRHAALRQVRPRALPFRRVGALRTGASRFRWKILMPSTVLDSDIFKDMFGTAEMRAVFSDDNLLKCYVEAEVALAVAQGRLGVVPREAADAIAKLAPTVTLDRDALKHEAENVGYPILGLVRQLSQKLGEPGRYVHWGATTQDIMDTGTVLQIRAALALVERDLAAVSDALAHLATKHRDTPMPGRTHLQQALPITFGYKCAIWLSMMDRHAARLSELKPRVLVAQFGGAAGTLASLGDYGVDVRREYARELKLGDPPITWHVARDAVAETVGFLGLLTGSLGKVGFDIMLMMMTELGEAFEPFASHRGASSTMPQKRNPISSEILVANAKAVRQHAALMLDAMVQDFERATGPWHVEWMAIPESFILTAGSLAQAKFMLEALVVDESRMRSNLELSQGLIVAEAVMMGLAPHLGRQQAHDMVYEACRAAVAQKRSLFDVLVENPAISAALSADRLRALCDPTNYLGSAPRMVDAIVRQRPGP